MLREMSTSCQRQRLLQFQKQRNTNAQDDTAQSAARSNSTEKANVPVELVRFRSQRVRDTVTSRHKVLKGTLRRRLTCIFFSFNKKFNI